MQGRNQKEHSGGREQHRQARRVTDKQIKQLIEASPVAIIVSSGKDERVELVNQKFIELFGYTAAEISDVAHWWPLAYPDKTYREKIKREWSERVEGAIREKSEIEAMEAIVTCKDGSRRYIEFRLSSIGKKHLVTFIDLTERKQMEDALREREQHSQSLLRLSRTLEQAETYAEVLNAAQDEVKTILGYQNLWVYLFTEDKAYARALVAGGPLKDAVMTGEGITTLAIKGDRMLEEIAAAREIIVVEDAQTDERTDKEIVAKLGNLTIVNVPIMIFDRHLGSVGTGTFGDEGVRPPTNSEREYLTALASHMAAALNRIHLLSDMKRAEEASKENSSLLERIFSSTEFLIAYLDADFNFMRVNRAYAEADDQMPEYFVGKNHFSLYPNDENKVIFQRVVDTGESYSAFAKPFVYAQHPERGVTYWNWTLHPVREGDGDISGLVISMVDVTERERAVIAQHESDERYRTLVEQAGDGIFVADPHGNYIDVNPSGCNMLGYTRDEILELNMRELTSAESQAKTPIRFDELRAGKSLISERTLVTKNGSLLPVEISGKMLDNGNFLGIVRDITERKRHELERKAIIAVSTALRQATTRTEILNVIMDQLEELFEADGVVLVLPNPQNDGFIDVMGRGPVGKRMKGLIIPPGKGVCNWVIANKKPYLNNHAEDDVLFYRPDLLGDSHCLASAPLIAREEAIGALWIARRKEITDWDLHLLIAISDIAASAIHRVLLREQTEQQVRRLLALHQIDIAITNNLDLDITLGIILKHVKTELEVDAASILSLNQSNHMLEYAAGIGFITSAIEKTQIKLGEDFAGRAALNYQTVSCTDLQLARETFGRSSLLVNENFVSHHVTPLLVKGEVKGVLEIFRRKQFKPEPDWINYFETLATQAAIAIENAELLENLQKSNKDLLLAYDATIEGWSRALDLRDHETEGHTRRVTQMALELAQKMGMSVAEQADLRRGALLHDIGKMGIPDSILLKPGALADHEWDVMRQHPLYARQMLSPIAYLNRAMEICYCHHERWDGSGYPRGLKGEEIPLSARVFAVVDVFDALTSDRPYRKAWPREEAYRYIREQAGKLFDPEVVRIFLETHTH